VTEPDDVDALRAALYRPGATEADRARYALAAGRPAPTGEPHPPRRRRRRPIVIVAAAGVVVAAAAATTLLVRPAPKPQYPTVASTPIALIGDAGEQAVSKSDLQTLFDDPKPFLGLYLSRHSTSLSSSLRTDSIAVDGKGTGPTTVSLEGITTPGQATGLMTVLLSCDRSTSYTWVLSGPRRTRTGASGDDCGGRIVTATFVPKADRVPTSIRVTVPKGVRVVVEVDLSKY
jgi:hypothetical protein